LAPATLIQAQRSAGGQPHRATPIERPRRYAKIVNLHDPWQNQAALAPGLR